MTREEAIEELERLLRHWDLIDEGIYDLSEHDKDAVDIALSFLRPVSREQVEKVWRGEWEDMREAYNDVPKRRCSRCKSVFIGLDTPFCEVCGAPMTDEAVEMVMERINKMEETGDGLG